jgi:hypothetical protein
LTCEGDVTWGEFLSYLERKAEDARNKYVPLTKALEQKDEVAAMYKTLDKNGNGEASL